MNCSLFAGFKNTDENVKTFLKGEQIQLLYRKVYRKKAIAHFYKQLNYFGQAFGCLS